MFPMSRITMMIAVALMTVGAGWAMAQVAPGGFSAVRALPAAGIAAAELARAATVAPAADIDTDGIVPAGFPPGTLAGVMAAPVTMPPRTAEARRAAPQAAGRAHPPRGPPTA